MDALGHDARSLRPTLRDGRASFEVAPRARWVVSTHFAVADRICAPYVGRPVTLVKVGVLHGGSLGAWRGCFGPQARIVGVKVNPAAKRLESEGFVIIVGDQANPSFWAAFHARVGPVDIPLDDGGPPFEQQVVTAECAAMVVCDGGLIVTADRHSSDLREVRGPSASSFVAYTKRLIDRIHARNGVASRFVPPERTVFVTNVYGSLVVLEIDRRACSEPSQTVWNDGAPRGRVDDVRHHARASVRRGQGEARGRSLGARLLHHDPFLRLPLRVVRQRVRDVRMVRSNLQARRRFHLRERMTRLGTVPA